MHRGHHEHTSDALFFIAPLPPNIDSTPRRDKHKQPRPPPAPTEREREILHQITFFISKPSVKNNNTIAVASKRSKGRHKLLKVNSTQHN